MPANLICLQQRLFNQCGLAARNEFEGMLQSGNNKWIVFFWQIPRLKRGFYFFIFYHVEVSELLLCLWIKSIAIYSLHLGVFWLRIFIVWLLSWLHVNRSGGVAPTFWPGRCVCTCPADTGLSSDVVCCLNSWWEKLEDADNRQPCLHMPSS